MIKYIIKLKTKLHNKIRGNKMSDFTKIEQKLDALEQSLNIMEKLNEVISSIGDIRFELAAIRNELALLKSNMIQIPIYPQYSTYPQYPIVHPYTSYNTTNGIIDDLAKDKK